MFRPTAVPSVEAAAVPEDAVLIDVREPEEWVAGHVDGARHIPLGELVARLDEVPAGRTVVVCRSGGRSAQAVAYLASTGRDAVNLDGGMQAWAGAGRPLVSETGAAPTVA